MNTEAPVATPATPEPAAPPAVPEATTIAEHEAQLATLHDPGDSGDGDVAPVPVERTRHRAKSQRATPEDVAQIAQLTKRLRDAEQALSIERQPGESDRVYQLRRRAEAAERAKATREAATAGADALPAPPKPAPISAPVVPPAPPATSAFTEAEPTLDQFNDKPDPYSAWTRALAAYDRRKEAFEAAQTTAQQRHSAAVQQADAARAAEFQRIGAAYQQRVQTYLQTQPDFTTVVSASDKPTPPLLEMALLTADNGPQLVYTLAQSPLFHDEAFLLTDGKPITEQAVASTQRWLTQRLQAVTTGSAAAASPTAPVPKPLNPVRTGPMSAADDPPPDGHSLRDHERFWAPKGRRR